jgi:hypothetical protein
VKNIPKILSFIRLDDHLSNSLFKFNALWDRTFFDGLGILKPQYISFYFIYNSACNNKTPTEVTKSILMHSTILKNTRNALSRLNIRFSNNFVAKFQHIVDAYQVDKKKDFPCFIKLANVFWTLIRQGMVPSK